MTAPNDVSLPATTPPTARRDAAVTNVAGRMSEERLGEIRVRERHATIGPWATVAQPGGRQCTLKRDYWQVGQHSAPYKGIALAFGHDDSDAQFIAHARTDIRDLLQHIDHLTRARDEAQTAVVELQAACEVLEDAVVGAQWEREEARVGRGGCPCEFVESCSKHCTCRNPESSGGCRRCCRYGSLEQQISAATRLAALGDSQAIAPTPPMIERAAREMGKYEYPVLQYAAVWDALGEEHKQSYRSMATNILTAALTAPADHAGRRGSEDDEQQGERT